MKNKIKFSQLVFFLVLVFVMFTTPLVVDVLLSIKFDIDLNKIEQSNIHLGQYIYAYAKAILLESLIMVLLYADFKYSSISFTLITGVVSLYFYNQFDFFAKGISAKLFIESIYSFIFPVVTALCSHIYLKSRSKEKEQGSNIFEDQNKTIEEQSNVIEQYSKQLEESSNLIKEQSNTIEKQSKENEALADEYFNAQETIEEVRTLEDQQRTKNKDLLQKFESAETTIEEQSNVIEQKNERIEYLEGIEFKYNKATQCPHCKKSFDPSGLNRHISMCEMNPKSKNYKGELKKV